MPSVDIKGPVIFFNIFFYNLKSSYISAAQLVRIFKSHEKIPFLTPHPDVTGIFLPIV